MKIHLGQSTSENINCLDTFRWFCNLELFVTNSSKRGSSACEGSVEFENYTIIQHFTMFHSFRLAIPSIIFALMINERNGIFFNILFCILPAPCNRRQSAGRVPPRNLSPSLSRLPQPRPPPSL